MDLRGFSSVNFGSVVKLLDDLLRALVLLHDFIAAEMLSSLSRLGIFLLD